MIELSIRIVLQTIVSTRNPKFQITLPAYFGYDKENVYFKNNITSTTFKTILLVIVYSPYYSK